MKLFYGYSREAYEKSIHVLMRVENKAAANVQEPEPAGGVGGCLWSAERRLPDILWSAAAI